MVNPGAFQGSHKEFVGGKGGVYQGVADGCTGEVLAEIQRRYFKSYPLDLPHDEEPTPEHLGAKLPGYEDDAAIQTFESRRRTLEFRKGVGVIVVVVYMKDHDLDPKDSGSINSFQVLIAKFTGKETNRPRLKPAVNLWRLDKRDIIEAKVKQRAEATNTPRGGYASLREKIVREMFGKLSQEEQRYWKSKAHEEHSAAMKIWKKEMAEPPSVSPEDRQRCIMGLVRFMQPILDVICESTGWKASFIAGGPEPAQGGRLNVISIHSGNTTGDIPVSFGRAERLRFKKTILPVYGTFLQRCYSPEECRSRALEPGDGVLSLQAVAVEDGDDVTVDTVDAPTTEGVLRAQSLPIQPPRQQSLPPSTSSTQVPAPSRGHSLPPTPFGSPAAPRPAHFSAGLSVVPLTVPSGVDSRAAAFSAPLPDHGADAPGTPTSSMLAGEPASAGSSVSDETPAPSANLSSSLPPSITGEMGGSQETQAPPVDCPSRGKKRGRKASTKGTAGQSGVPATESSQPSIASERITHNAAATDAPASQPPAKRARTSRNPPSIPTNLTESSSIPITSFPVGPTSEAPKWFKNTLSMVQRGTIGKEERWKELVHVWSTFEAQQQYADLGKLKNTNRPAAIGAWIARARSATWDPAIIDIGQYQIDFMKWWTALQPEWRISGDGKILFEKVDGDWGVLKKSGVNGVVSVIAGLYYWGSALKGDGGRDEWLVAVKDCLAAFKHFHNA
ncbi:hypothetical protein CVT25_001652 [Psilocybe cyanescens]|uniref:Uncharacterized protein n=1 Tax=Psilocybe cyanescens TaxID=93625 RepID=A0A409WQ48_PSICY|nr:hypothetical protein CVT25_001652 [Psilocybe cyanescens]